MGNRFRNLIFIAALYGITLALLPFLIISAVTQEWRLPPAPLILFCVAMFALGWPGWHNVKKLFWGP